MQRSLQPHVLRTARMILRATMQAAALSATTLQTAAAAEPPVAPTRLFWGDTHVHTAYSFDANIAGTDTTPADAFRFARGETVTLKTGKTARLERPLDFLVVSDHAEYLGALRLISRDDPFMLAQPFAARLRAIQIRGGPEVTGAMIEIGQSYQTGQQLMQLPEGEHSPWSEIVAAAAAADAPGSFSAFAGFEWSSMPDGDNLHRVVVFGDGPERLLQTRPFSAIDSNDPADLWRHLADYRQRTGGEAIAIPHNSNLSGGQMFTQTDFRGEPLSADAARARARNEPLVEVTQIKGDSESHPGLSPEDPFAGFGVWDEANIAMTRLHTPSMLRQEYAREALKTGLALGARLGINPYAFGMIGSTDTHTGLSTADDANFWGKFLSEAPDTDRAGQSFGLRKVGDGTVSIARWEELASGYMAIWAPANTREALLDAMRRREVYASTGPRIALRFFGGWNFSAADLAGDVAVAGYRRGVPMGACLGKPSAAAPSFLLSALKDPAGANLDRLQIVKGWVAADGSTRERVHDVAWSAGRQPDADGSLPPVGSTVDTATATYENSIGASTLAATWTDPDFDPAEPAFYYVRVLEIPTPRWVLYDRARLGTVLPDDAAITHQERVYSSPIWFETSPGSACPTEHDAALR